MGLISTLKNMRDLKGPQFLHIMTKKGRGYEPAEKDPITFHAVPKFDPSSGCLPKSSGGLPGYSKIFGDWLCETAAKDSKLMAITPAMREGSGMVEFSRKFPDRYFDVAIASSMPSPSPQVWRLAAISPSWRSTLLSCNAPTTRSSMTSLSRNCRLCSPSIAPYRWRGWTNAPGRVRSLLSALHPGYGDHDAKRRERMSPDVIYRVSL
ncbi:1-deoxy-D-xylulose-5-phosphate synthase [Salmonella enterica subsp. arizonae]|uniref:1-deoxy-D-xylulose-5-phosphate synthase n=1 Tax=Salmonella enterica subsp. arizonae TaxID=59203 RepID=A0A447R8I0_SALER|nr:1-deoxy-D-xylulose-5-phosphate synthase [Salmonella enterica subsp. arizonae]